jgi:hypothetical protein
VVRSQPQQILHKTYLENAQHKNGLTEWLKLVDHLPSKHDTPNSNPSTTKKKKKRKREREREYLQTQVE